MPTRWTYNETSSVNSAKERLLHFLHFGRSFGRCDRPSNLSCVLSDDCHGDEADDRDGYNITKCCRLHEEISDNWRSLTWYYLQLDVANNISEIELEFGALHSDVSLSEEVPPCDNVSLNIQPFGSVPFHREPERMLQQLHDMSRDVRFNTFQISGRNLQFLLRCVECRHGLASLAIRILSVCPSVRQTRALLQNERKIPYHSKDHSAHFSEKKNGWWGRPLVPEILGQRAPVEAKAPILNR